jgi:hypothetical protein
VLLEAVRGNSNNELLCATLAGTSDVKVKGLLEPQVLASRTIERAEVSELVAYEARYRRSGGCPSRRQALEGEPARQVYWVLSQRPHEQRRHDGEGGRTVGLEVARHVAKLLKGNLLVKYIWYNARTSSAGTMEKEALPMLQRNRLRSVLAEALRAEAADIWGRRLLLHRRRLERETVLAALLLDLLFTGR